MREINKLAKEFENRTSELSDEDDLFGVLSAQLEAKQLAHLSGKLRYKADKHQDPKKGKQLKEAARLIMLASDLLKMV